MQTTGRSNLKKVSGTKEGGLKMRKAIFFAAMIFFLGIALSARAAPLLPPPPGVRVTVPLPPPIAFPAPPEVVILPETEVYAVPSVPEEIFFYNGWWWRPWNGRWYRSLHYDSGWGGYGGVPFWYGRIPHDWREDYRNHLWGGHPWNYHYIPHSDLQRNWRTWHNTHYWDKPEHREFTHYHDGRPYGAGQGNLHKDTTGTKAYSAGRTTAGRTTMGQHATGQVSKGQHTAGQTTTRQHTTRHITTNQHIVGHTTAGQHSTGQTGRGQHTTRTERKK